MSLSHVHDMAIEPSATEVYSVGSQPTHHIFKLAPPSLSSSWSIAPVLDVGMTPHTEIDTFNLPIMSFLSILGQNSNFFKFL